MEEGELRSIYKNLKIFYRYVIIVVITRFNDEGTSSPR